MQWSDRIGLRLKLRDLHILLAVVKSGSMGKAATDLAVSQPSISKAIADVEHAIGLRLLDRSSRGIEPTIYGRALLKCGVAVFDELRRGVKELEFLTDPTAGELRVGCTESLAAGFVSAVVDRLSRQYPRVVFHLLPADRATLLDHHLRERIVELAVTTTTGLVSDRDMELKQLFDDRFVVMAGAQSKWIRRRKLSLADLVNELWVLPPPDSLPGLNIAEIFRSGSLEPPQAHVVSYSVPLHHHLPTGRYITMRPRSMLRFGKYLPLKSLPIKTPPNTYPTGIITLKNRTLGPLAQLFIDQALKLARPLQQAD
jgi:DNA-binding transcriptional LysR family regulator